MSVPDPSPNKLFHLLPVRDLIRAVIVGLGFAIVLSLADSKGPTDRAALPVALFLVTFGGWIALTVLRSWLRATARPSPRTAALLRVERPVEPSRRPASLEALEGLVLAARDSDAAANRRLRPRLEAVATHRLGRHGLRPDGDARALDRALGSDAAAVLAARGAVTFEDLDAALDALEQL